MYVLRRYRDKYARISHIHNNEVFFVFFFVSFNPKKNEKKNTNSFEHLTFAIITANSGQRQINTHVKRRRRRRFCVTPNSEKQPKSRDCILIEWHE